MTERIHPKYGYTTALLAFAFCLGMLVLNFTMENFECFSIALFAAALVCGAQPLICSAFYLLAGGLSFLTGGLAFLVFAIQAVLLGGTYFLCDRLRRTIKAEIVLLLICALLPFLWLYGKYIYDDYIKAAILAAAIFVLCFVFIGALRCALFRAGKCRLTAEELFFCAVAVAAAGIGVYNCAGSYVYEGAALFLLLLVCALTRNGNAAFCAAVLALPVLICESAASGVLQTTSLAIYLAYAVLALAFLRAGKLPAALLVFLAAVCVHYLQFFSSSGSFQLWSMPQFYLSLIAPLLACLIFALIPEAMLSRLFEKIKRYGERQLTKASINHNRALIGKKLFDISNVFREIESAFLCLEQDTETEDSMRAFLYAALQKEVCENCPKAADCTQECRSDALFKLIFVGCGKGKVNLIDLPSDLTAQCINTSALLFSLNKLLADYRKHFLDADNAAQGRQLLADQAHALAEMLKTLAVEQSEPVGQYAKTERDLKNEFSKNGLICEEVFLFGNPPQLLLTAVGSVNGEKLQKTAESVLHIPLVLAEKQALTGDKFYRLYRKKPQFDAAFGVASRTKEGETACGDTHSVSKIDERTFLCALADGMGSGEFANRISDCALSLLESFYRAGMNGDTVLPAVNRLLSFNRQESFACLDAAAVNLDSGRADIVKVGSPLSFLLSDAKIEILESDSLPLGILEGVHPTVLSRTLKDGDVLLFLSDGITSAFGSSADIADFLSTAHLSNPQTLADEILAAALARTGETAQDDMTILAVRLFSALPSV